MGWLETGVVVLTIVVVARYLHKELREIRIQVGMLPDGKYIAERLEEIRILLGGKEPPSWIEQLVQRAKQPK